MRLALVPGIVVLLTATAGAQPSPEPEDEKLFREGRALADQGKFKEACEKFERSLELDPGNGTKLNFANCHEKLGHVALAWRLFDQVADSDKITDPDRSKFARDRADKLMPKLGVVILKITTPDAPTLRVSIADRIVKPAPVVTEVVDPGNVVISVTANGAEPFQKREKIAAGKRVTVEVPVLSPAAPPRPIEPVVTPTEQPIQEVGELPDERGVRRRSRVLLAYGLGIAGGVSMIAGVAVGLEARSDWNAEIGNGCYRQMDEVFCSDGESELAQLRARRLGHVGTALGVGGFALLAAGAIVFMTAPRDVAVTPTATASSAGISVVGRF
jgi:hypothetical protein